MSEFGFQRHLQTTIELDFTVTKNIQGILSSLKVSEYICEMMEFGLQRHLQTTIELEITDSGVVVLNSATRNAKSKAQLSTS